MRAVTLSILLGVLILASANQDDSGPSERSYKRSLQSKNARSSNVEDNASSSSIKGKIADSNNSKSSQRNKRGIGISAWGIIGIIVAIISLSTIGYYTFVLYPYLCKKQHSYDMMEFSDIV